MDVPTAINNITTSFACLAERLSTLEIKARK
jgi:hypothetical protein